MKTEASLSRLGATEGRVNVSVNLMISASTPTSVPSLRCICVMQYGSSLAKSFSISQQLTGHLREKKNKMMLVP